MAILDLLGILDLLRIRRQDEEEEDEDLEGTEDSDEETEDETGGGGLLGRLNVVNSLGRVFRRDGGDDEGEEDEEDGDAPGAEDETEDGESAGGLLSRFMVVCIMVVRRLGDILRRGSGDGDDEDEAEDEDDAALPVAITPTPGPQLQTIDGPDLVDPEPEVLVNAAAPQDGTGDSPSAQNDHSATGLEEAPENSEKALEPERLEAQVAISPAAMRLRELARSQEDVPVAELADDLQELLGLLGGRRR